MRRQCLRVEGLRGAIRTSGALSAATMVLTDIGMAAMARCQHESSRRQNTSHLIADEAGTESVSRDNS